MVEKEGISSPPNLYLIGGMRCGSTTLHASLDAHPQIFMAPVKEPSFFIAEAMRHAPNLGPQHPDTVTYVAQGRYRTREAYTSLFDDYSGERYLGEASHYLYHPATIPLISAICPNPRIVVSVRQPAERLFSEYLYRCRVGQERRNFREFALEKLPKAHLSEECQKTTKEHQAALISPWIEEFGAKQVKIILFDDLEANPQPAGGPSCPGSSRP